MIDKVSGEITIMPIHRLEMIDVKKKVQYLKRVMENQTPPSKCYEDKEDGKSGNRKLAVGCVFCSHKVGCWSDVNDGHGLRAFKYSNGIRYLSHISRLPDVEEVPTVDL